MRVVAERYGLEGRRAQRMPEKIGRRARQAFADAWYGEFSTLLLVQALQHAADCGHPDCDRCATMLRRLDEPDLLGASEAAGELERLLELEVAAAELVEALDSTDPDRGLRAMAAAAKIRAAVETETDLMTRSKFTRQERHRIGYESIGMSKAEVLKLASDLEVSEAFVYKWRKKVTEAGPEALEAARLNLPPPDPDESDDLRHQLTIAQRTIKDLQATVSHQAVQLARYNAFVRERYAVTTKLLPRA